MELDCDFNASIKSQHCMEDQQVKGHEGILAEVPANSSHLNLKEPAITSFGTISANSFQNNRSK